MPNYTLHSFNFRGCCEGLRLVFYYAGVPFVDQRYEHDDFAKHRDAFPYKQLPVLEVDGKQLAQMRAIIRYLSQEFNLNGKDKWEAAKLDEFMELQAEFNQEINYYYAAVFGCGGEGTREELKRSKFIPAIEKYLPLFEKALDRAGSGFYTKNGPSGVDLWMAEIIDFMNKCDPEVFVEHPKLLDQMKRVHALPELQEYLASDSRPPPFNTEEHLKQK